MIDRLSAFGQEHRTHEEGRPRPPTPIGEPKRVAHFQVALGYAIALINTPSQRLPITYMRLNHIQVRIRPDTKFLVLIRRSLSVVHRYYGRSHRTLVSLLRSATYDHMHEHECELAVLDKFRSQ